MSTRHVLSDLIDEWVKSMRSEGLAKNTMGNRDLHLRAFVAVVGNIQVRSVEPRHIDTYFAKRQTDGLQPSSLNSHLDSVKSFFLWAVRNRYLTSDRNPVQGRRAFRVQPKARLRVPASDFGRLLDCAPHPRDRIVVALGLYLFLRQSEIAPLRLEDVDLDTGYVQVKVEKSSLLDDMPICQELDYELRRWLVFYGERADLSQVHYLCPSKSSLAAPKDSATGRFLSSRPTSQEAALKPDRKMVGIHLAAQRTLEIAGYPLKDDSGKSKHEGVHTLRRSGARALYDHRMEEGLHDGAIREVQAMLHHKSISMTERYLGIEMDRAARDKRLRGQRMFAAPQANVISLVREA